VDEVNSLIAFTGPCHRKVFAINCGLMGFNQTSYRAGQSTGRKPGAQNRISGELRERLKNRGGKDPAEYLSEVVSDEKQPQELRIAASNVLMLTFTTS
jgi:hypothetical protein